MTSFKRCIKKLWVSIHRRELAKFDAETGLRFTTGNVMGDIACSPQPECVMVEAEPDLSTAVAETARLIADDHVGPIFEATFEHKGVLARVEVLGRRGEG